MRVRLCREWTRSHKTWIYIRMKRASPSVLCTNRTWDHSEHEFNYIACACLHTHTRHRLYAGNATNASHSKLFISIDVRPEYFKAFNWCWISALSFHFATLFEAPFEKRGIESECTGYDFDSGIQCSQNYKDSYEIAVLDINRFPIELSHLCQYGSNIYWLV